MTEHQPVEAEQSNYQTQLEVLREINRATQARPSNQDISAVALRGLSRLIPFQYGSVVQFDFQTNQTHSLAIQSTDATELEPIASSQIDPGLVQRLQAGQPYTMEDTAPASPRSSLYAALMQNDELMGAIILDKPEPPGFTPDHLTIIAEVANQLAHSIEYIRLFNADQQRMALVTALHETGLDLAQQLDLPSLLQTIVERAARLAQASMGSLYLFEPDGATLRLEVGYNLKPELAISPIRPGQGVAGRVAQTGEALVVANYQHWPGRIADVPPNGYQSVLGVPIQWRGRALGVINVLDETVARFGQAQLETVRLFAAQAAVAIQNAQLFQATSRQLEELTILHGVASAGAETNVEAELIRRAIDIIGTGLFPINCGVLIIDETAGALRVYISEKRRATSQAPEWLPLDKGVIGEVLALGEPKRIGDIRQTPAYLEISPGMLSELCVPLKVADKLIGAINVESPELDAFSEADERLLATFAGQLATAIERIRIEKALQVSEERYRGAIVAAGLVPYTIDYPSKRFTFIGEDIVKLTGYTAAEITPAIMKASVQEEYLWGPNASLSVTEVRERIKAGIPSEWQNDMRILTRTGESRWLSDSSVAVVNAQGRAIGAIGIFQDITERKRVEAEIQALNTELEQRVRERTAQLEAANEDLESFSYSVSHDLRAPLRSISGFSQILLDDYYNQFNAEGQRSLRTVLEQCQRMDQLIEDVLNLSHVSRTPAKMGNVNLSILGEVVFARLGQQDPQRQVECRVTPNLVVTGDRSLLNIVLDNLLGNAWKFTSKQPAARIELGMEQLPEGVSAYFVRDNGAGFDMTYAGKLFGAFERLHSQHDFAGTGIGLATVQRVIQRHGGRVWAVGEVNQGATFYFTLPSANLPASQK